MNLEAICRVGRGDDGGGGRRDIAVIEWWRLCVIAVIHSYCVGSMNGAPTMVGSNDGGCLLVEGL
jgi:hypothetical protein